MKTRSARFLLSAAELEGCPPADRPEFAFIGRSNVGKSSLLNLLCQQKGLAHVSGKPGRTRTINFYLVNEAFYFVDLPGYGYAKVAKRERYQFQDVAADYLELREGLTHVFVLIDVRLEPQRIDLEFLSWLAETRVPFSLVFTKADKLKPAKARASADRFLETLGGIVEEAPAAFLTSAQDRTGRNELLGFIGEMAG